MIRDVPWGPVDVDERRLTAHRSGRSGAPDRRPRYAWHPMGPGSVTPVSHDAPCDAFPSANPTTVQPTVSLVGGESDSTTRRE
jgi:hypothetical protein